MPVEKSKLQSIKNRLKVEDLSFEEREALFTELQKAGGKIVEITESDDPVEKFKRRSAVYQKFKDSSKVSTNKNTQSAPVGNHNVRSSKESSNPFRETKKPASTTNFKTSTIQLKHEVSKKVSVPSSWFLFWIKLNCFIGGLTNWGAKYFSQRFIKRMLDTNKQKIIRIQFLLEPIFKEKTSQTLAFRSKIADENRLLDYELAYHTYKLFDLRHFIKLQTEMPSSVLRSEQTLKEIFTNLYLFNRYATQLKISTMLILQKFKQQFPDSISGNPSMAFDKIWNSLIIPIYFDLEQMIEFYMNYTNVVQKSLVYKTIDDYLQTTNKHITIGMLAQDWKEQYLMKSMQMEKSLDGEENHEEGADEVPASIYPNQQFQKDVEFLLSSINYQKILHTFQKNTDLRSNFSSDDKLFYTYVILDYLDKEFSTLWVGDEIQYYTVADGTSVGRFDAKKEVVAQNHRLNSAHEWINDYLRRKNETEKMVARTYDQKNLVVQQHLKEISRSSFNVRQNIQTLLYDFMLLIDKLTQSANTSNSLIGNFEQVIALPRSYSNRLINGMTVKDALVKSRNLMAALLWLLKYGDLSGMSANISEPIVFKDVVIKLE
ncbi:MAG: hypothetical protein ACRCTJ_03435 [Brevinema sp.]